MQVHLIARWQKSSSYGSTTPACGTLLGRCCVFLYNIALAEVPLSSAFSLETFFFFFKAELPAFVLLLRQQSSLIQINKGAAFVHAELMLVWTLLIALPGLIQWEPVIDFTNTHHEQRWRELEVTGTWPDAANHVCWSLRAHVSFLFIFWEKSLLPITTIWNHLVLFLVGGANGDMSAVSVNGVYSFSIQ